MTENSSEFAKPNTESPPSCFSFQKHQRLLNKHDFSKVFDDAPIRAAHPSLLILSRANKLGYPRVGIVVGKKNVKHAHQRNAIKRIARESFRLQQHNLPPIDAIVLARRGSDLLSHEELHKILTGLWRRIIKRAEKETS